MVGKVGRDQLPEREQVAYQAFASTVEDFLAISANWLKCAQ
jgi:hypothetical protein